MRFRPCIDIHNGKVKQIVRRASRTMETGRWRTSLPSGMPTIMRVYIEEDGLKGGHVIL